MRSVAVYMWLRTFECLTMWARLCTNSCATMIKITGGHENCNVYGLFVDDMHRFWWNIVSLVISYCVLDHFISCSWPFHIVSLAISYRVLDHFILFCFREFYSCLPRYWWLLNTSTHVTYCIVISRHRTLCWTRPELSSRLGTLEYPKYFLAKSLQRRQ